MIKKQLLLFFLVVFHYGNIESQNLEDLLYELPDVIFKEIQSVEGYKRAYELQIKQINQIIRLN